MQLRHCMIASMRVQPSKSEIETMFGTKATQDYPSTVVEEMMELFQHF